MYFSGIFKVFFLVIVSPFPAPAVSQELQQPYPIKFFKSLRSVIGASDTCSVIEFRCPDGICIIQNWLCDGDKDCPDGADEKYCQNNTCSVDQFRCPSGECIQRSLVCDGENDCRDGADEQDCQNYPIECRRIDPDYCHEPFLKENCPNTCKPVNADDLETHELWLHILLQLDRPYEDRLTTHRGDKKYIYHLNNENIDPTKPGTEIIIPTIDAFTTGKERLDKILNYQKGRDVVPSMFDPDVKEAVNQLHALYQEHSGAKGILKVAVNGKDHINEYLHMLTLMHAIIYDKELYGFGLPAFYDVIPEFFTKSKSCDAPSRQCCQVEEYPHNLDEEEWKVSYIREGAAFNNFHGSWHNYNHWYLDNIPLNRGELFFYFHNQLVARYNMARISNGLKPVKPLDNWSKDSLIPQNYRPPILTDTLTRCPNMSAGILGKKLGTYRNNLENAITKESLMKEDGSFVSLLNNDGIKYVGCALEHAKCGDLNLTLYGGNFGIHNTGHGIISGIGCTGPHLNTSGVMGNPWRAVRDPIFFRWHKFVDDLFQSHKKKLLEYKLPELALDSVSVSSIDVQSGGRSKGKLFTFKSTLKMTMWLNRTESACIHQPTENHHPFTYNINVNNNAEYIDVNVRIYMAPNPKKEALTYEELRTRWALMDRFDFRLNPGNNTINRASCSSSITVPRPKSLQELSNIYKDEKSFNEFKSKPTKCQCGLPEHLLIPRGTPEGMPYQLFVYITRRNKKQSKSSDCPNQECGDLCSKDFTNCDQSDGASLSTGR